MCGIAGIYRRGNADIPRIGVFADELLYGIAERGRDATGLLTINDDGRVHLEKDIIAATRFVRFRKPIPKKARAVLLHTRFATVGDQYDVRNAHPQASGTVAAIHNGTIYNANELFRRYNLPRWATVDSEIIPALVNHVGWDKAAEAFEQFDGGAATALINQHKPQELLLAKTTGWPLEYVITPDFIVWASTQRALREAWYRVFGESLQRPILSLADGHILRINGAILEETFTPIRRTYGGKSKWSGTAGSRVTFVKSGEKKAPKKQSKKAEKKARKAAAKAAVRAVGTKKKQTDLKAVEDATKVLEQAANGRAMLTNGNQSAVPASLEEELDTSHAEWRDDDIVDGGTPWSDFDIDGEDTSNGAWDGSYPADLDDRLIPYEQGLIEIEDDEDGDEDYLASERWYEPQRNRRVETKSPATAALEALES